MLVVVLLLGMSTWFSASAVIPQLRDEWAMSAGTAAWLTIAVQLGFVGGALFSSVFNVADILEAQRVIFIGAIGAALVNALLLAVDSPAPAIALRFGTGFFLAGVYPPALKLIATWYRSGRGVAVGILVGALTVGTGAPHLVNGLGGLEWQTVVWATSAITAAGALVVMTVRVGPYPFARAQFDPRQVGVVFKSRGVRLASLGYFGHMWELYGMWAWFVVFFRAVLEEHAVTDGTLAAYVTFAVIGIGALGCWIGGVAGDRWGRTRTTTAMMATSAACCLLVPALFGAPVWAIVVLGLLWGVAVVGDSAQFSTMVTELADQAYVGTALTLQLAIGFTLTVATIWLLPLLAESLTWRWAFAFLAPGPALGCVAMIRLRRSPEAAHIAGGRG
ncbi:MAG: MFS transporter [Actinomycetota bacterium]